MTILIIVSLFVVAFVVWGIFVASKGVPRKISELERPLSDLLILDSKSGFLIIDHKKSEKFIQYEKYTDKNNMSGIALSFPDVEWSHPYAQKLVDYCRSREIDFETTRGTDGTKFIGVDYGKDVKSAYVMLNDILLNIFEISEDDKFYALLEFSADS